MTDQSRLVVTGALGHIGSRLIQALRPGEFDEVVLIDNLATQRYCSLFNLSDGIAWRFVEADVTSDTLDLVSLLTGASAVVHLAAITNAAASFEIQEQVERVNYYGTERVALACVAAACPMLFLSTTSVYGVSDGVVDEDCPPEYLKPQSPYAGSKLKAERMLTDLGNDHGLRFVTARFGTIYGASAGMRFHTAVNKFIWQACLGQSLTVWRTALEQKRPYLELGDAVAAIRFVVRSNLFDNCIYNVLTENLTVRQITDAIQEQIPDLRIEFVDQLIMNQLSYTVDRSRIESHGFRFLGNIRNGVRETVNLLRPLAAVRLNEHAK